MTAAPVKQLDLTPPPVVKTIAQRSLIVGVVFGIVAVVLAFIRPNEFFRAYLLGFMCWLGVALGSMAIIMIRHLTGGGWGVVIRRIQGAAMRTLPLLTLCSFRCCLGSRSFIRGRCPLESVQEQAHS